MSERWDAETRRLRRELLRRHHPDAGGDAAEFIRVLQQFSPRSTRRPDLGEVRFVRRPRGLGRVTSWWRRRTRRRRGVRRVL